MFSGFSFKVPCFFFCCCCVVCYVCEIYVNNIFKSSRVFIADNTWQAVLYIAIIAQGVYEL